MIKSNLISLLQTFSKDEIKKFVAFVSSPVNNKEKVLIRLAEVIFENFPAMMISKQELFGKLYPGKKYNDALLRNIMSDMMKLAEQFLIGLRLEKENFYKEFFLIRELTGRNQQKLSIKKIEKLLKQVNEEKIKDDEHFNRLYLLENEKPSIYRSEKSLHHIEDENTPQIIENKLISFFITTLKLNAYMLNKIKHIYEFKYDKTFLEDSLSYLDGEGKDLKENLYVNFYYNAIRLFITEDEKYYFELRKIAESEYDKLNELEKKNVYVVLANYCSIRILKGDFGYYRELFNLYKDILAKGAQYEGFSYFSHILFKKIVTTAIEVNELNWAEDFLEKYSQQLNDDYQESSIHICKACLNFKRKNYNEALMHLSKVQTEDVSFNEDIRLLEIKIFFEAGYPEQFHSAIDRFKHYIHSTKEVSERRKQLYSEFINSVVKLSRIREAGGKDFHFNLKQFREAVMKSKNASNKKWLIGTVDEMIS